MDVLLSSMSIVRIMVYFNVQRSMHKLSLLIRKKSHIPGDLSSSLATGLLLRLYARPYVFQLSPIVYQPDQPVHADHRNGDQAQC
jgi:hypothetical protein